MTIPLGVMAQVNNPGGSGTVTGVSVTTANGVSGTVATSTTTPAITITLGAITPSSVASSGAVSGSTVSQNGNQDFSLPGTGLSASGSTINSNAVYQIPFTPGTLTGITNTISMFGKITKTSTVDNLIGSAFLFSCVSNPTITLYECGTSSTCVSPTTIGSVSITAAGQAFNGTISSSAITAGDYIAWAITAGTCTSLDIQATAQIHSN